MIFISCALQSEAQAIIEFYKLKKSNSNPKIYQNETIVLLIMGIGKENTITKLEYMFKNYEISKAINIGIAGCNDSSIKIGELFCTNKILNDIKYLQLKTVDKPQIVSSIINPTLYDMEGKYFLEISSKYLAEENIYIFKIVSDHLDDKILAKDYIKSLVYKHIKSYAII